LVPIPEFPEILDFLFQVCCSVPDTVGSFLHVEDCVQGLRFNDVMNKSGMRTSDEKGNDWPGGGLYLRLLWWPHLGTFSFLNRGHIYRFPRSMMGVCPGG
jgi:hypothetical protein